MAAIKRHFGLSLRKTKRFFKKIDGEMHFDLGLASLLPQWRGFFKSQGLKEDIMAGMTVACITVPLALAIALASGVSPAVGLITAIIAGAVCALFGGTPLVVSGPAAALAVLIAYIVQQHGMQGLLFVGFGCGVLQLFTGIFGLGRIIHFVPTPVITGFTAGIGAIIFISQLPRALGLPPPDQSHVFDVIAHIQDLIHQTHWGALGLALSAMLVTIGLPRLWPRVPAPFVALVLPTATVFLFGWDVPIIGEVPHHFLVPRLPLFMGSGVSSLMEPLFIVFTLASLETLITATATHKLVDGQKYDPNQELIGQGLGNIVVSIFGGIPITAVFAQSALNVQAGARTRRAAVIHSLVLVGMVIFFGSILRRIPEAVLAGVLLSVALRMLHPREFFELWKSSRGDAMIYAITGIAIVCMDLAVGIQAGVVTALVIAAVRFSQTQTKIGEYSALGAYVLSVTGPLNFLSSRKMEVLQKEVDSFEKNRGLIVDVSQVTAIDTSGAQQLLDFLKYTEQQGVVLVLRGLNPKYQKILKPFDTEGIIPRVFALTEADVLRLLGQGTNQEPLQRLVYGVSRFRNELRGGYYSLFSSLAKEQKPHTLFIACSDSRVNPNLITATDPGELFIVRNVGNVIPAFGVDDTPAEGAAVEFAIGVLGVKEVVVCGHSGCGAMKAVLTEGFFSSDQAAKYPSLAKWLRGLKDLKEELPAQATPEQAAERNALMQLDNLRSYPLIQEQLKQGKIRLHAWYFDISNMELNEWDEERKIFVPVGHAARTALMKRIASGIQYQVPHVKPSS